VLLHPYTHQRARTSLPTTCIGGLALVYLLHIRYYPRLLHTHLKILGPESLCRKEFVHELSQRIFLLTTRLRLLYLLLPLLYFPPLALLAAVAGVGGETLGVGAILTQLAVRAHNKRARREGKTDKASVKYKY
jgi:hypothetical protein